MYTILPSSLVEQARERQRKLQLEAATYRLLQQVKKQPGRVSILRRAVVATGNGLIAGGTWLKRCAQQEPTYTDLQTVSGRFAR